MTVLLYLNFDLNSRKKEADYLKVRIGERIIVFERSKIVKVKLNNNKTLI